MLTASQVRGVVETAVTAPSVHNTQPWSFAPRADGLDVLADAQRALPHQDPAGRELVMSCGAASLHAELAVRGLGHACRSLLLPDPERPEVVARIVVDGSQPPAEEDLRLLEAVPRRHTDRGPFADWPVPVPVLDVLGRAAAVEGAWLQVLSTADMLELAVWQAHAQADLAADGDALAERAVWARSASGTSDGLPAEDVPGWSAGRRAPGAARHVPPSPDDLVLVLGTARDDRLSWVRAGRALDRVLLTATHEGLVAAPATLVLELPTVRQGLSAALALRGAPQVVLRAGYPSGVAAPRPGRRPVDEVLVRSA
jgi:nitroreductase